MFADAFAMSDVRAECRNSDWQKAVDDSCRTRSPINEPMPPWAVVLQANMEDLLMMVCAVQRDVSTLAVSSDSTMCSNIKKYAERSTVEGAPSLTEAAPILPPLTKEAATIQPPLPRLGSVAESVIACAGDKSGFMEMLGKMEHERAGLLHELDVLRVEHAEATAQVLAVRRELSEECLDSSEDLASAVAAACRRYHGAKDSQNKLDILQSERDALRIRVKAMEREMRLADGSKLQCSEASCELADAPVTAAKVDVNAVAEPWWRHQPAAEAAAGIGVGYALPARRIVVASLQPDLAEPLHGQANVTELRSAPPVWQVGRAG